MPTSYDRLMASLADLPDVSRSRATPVRVITPLLGNVETFIIQTYRQRDQGDTIFVERSGPEGLERYYLPPKVVKVLIRQRDGLERQNRRRAARETAKARLDAGVRPFVKKP